MSSEEDDRMKQDRMERLTFICQVIAGVVVIGTAWLVTYAVQKKAPVPFSYIVSDPSLILLRVMYILIWIVLFVTLVGLNVPQVIEYKFNPLTEREENDPLEREVMLNCSGDRAFDLCIRSLHRLWRYPVKKSDRSTMNISAWSFTDSSAVRFLITEQGKNQCRVVIKGSTPYVQYSNAREMARQLSRRRCIELLDRIRAYLQEQDPDKK